MICVGYVTTADYRGAAQQWLNRKGGPEMARPLFFCISIEI